MRMSCAELAIEHVAARSKGPTLPADIPITINFHPDSIFSDTSMLATLAVDGTYRSQFETDTSSGSLSAQAGGRRWVWESEIFNGAYDHAPPEQRPKYGALNYRESEVGGSPRFGSAHLRLKPNVLGRSTFAYPDSNFRPTDFGVSEAMNLMGLAEENRQHLDALDDYIEAHIHGPIRIKDDVEALVLDPSFRGTEIEGAARSLAVDVEWHAGFCLKPGLGVAYADYRGIEIAGFIENLSRGSELRPADLTRLRGGSVDPQIVKKTWHCLARFGAPENLP